MQPFYQLTAVDVRRAEVQGSSRATTIDKLTFPGIDFAASEFSPGGSVMAVNFLQSRIAAPEPKFSIKGLDLDIFGGLGKRDRWVFAGAYREVRPGGGGMVGARSIIEGAVATWEPDESDPSELQGCNHTFKEVTHVELTLGEKEIFYVDVFERVLRFNGVDHFEEVRRALGA